VSQTPGKLERRARALLRAYPAEYRDGRAEEIIGTLLEAAPPGRSFPTAREAWSLIAGGRHARAVRNHRPGVKANLRLALLLGISTYLSSTATADAFLPGMLQGDRLLLTYTTGGLCLAVALAPWLGSRVVAAALAIPAFTLSAYALLAMHASEAAVSLAELLILMAALAALSGGPVRLPRSWLWLPGAFPLPPVAVRLLSPRHALNGGLASVLLLWALVLLTGIVVCWLATDARPALALGLAVSLEALMGTLSVLVIGDFRQMIQGLLMEFAITLPILLPAAWLLLRRQKTPGQRPFPEP
jgi:hypothetical protein